MAAASTLLRVASNTLIVPPFEVAWLSQDDYGLQGGACCLLLDCKGESDVTIILKQVPGAKRWQHLQRRQGPGGGEQLLAVEDNYTLILGSHRNSKLKVEKNGEEVASASGLPGCTVDPATFTRVWVNYDAGVLSVGTGAAGGQLSFSWSDPGPPIDVRHVGLSCWDTHVSYRNVQLLPPLPRDTLAKLAAAQQAARRQLHLLQLVLDRAIAALTPAGVFHSLQLSELLLPRARPLYEASVQLAGAAFGELVERHLGELAGLSLEAMADILHEPLLDVPEPLLFEAVAAWCQFGAGPPPAPEDWQQSPEAPAAGLEEAAAAAAGVASAGGGGGGGGGGLRPEEQGQQWEEGAWAGGGRGVLGRPAADALEVLQLVRFSFMTQQQRQAVLAHPFSRVCPLVRQCVLEDLRRLADCSSALPEGCYTFEQRRLVRPAPGQPPPLPAPAGVPRGSGDGGGGGGGGGWRRYRRRLAPSCKELMFVSDGDRNGVLHYIGTDYGTRQWVNPVLSRAVELRASSPPSRFTDAKALVSGQFLNTSFAGPRYVRAAPPGAAAAAPAAPSTWWQLDLGQRHRLLCNYYTIRHDGSPDGFVRSWALQGSNDLQHWVDLRRHVGDTTIRLPGQYGSWPIHGPASSMPFRAFRLVLLGPTQSPANPWAFCLSFWELYGFFHKLQPPAAAAAAAPAAEDQQQPQQQQQREAGAPAAASAGQKQAREQRADDQPQQQQEQQQDQDMDQEEQQQQQQQDH